MNFQFLLLSLLFPIALACREDAKVCQNGLVVMRNPELNCEFNPCPQNDAAPDITNECPSGFKICPNGEAVLRDPENDCEFFECFTEEDETFAPDEEDETAIPQDVQITTCNMTEFKICDSGSFENGTRSYRNPHHNCEFDPCTNDTTGSTKFCDGVIIPCETVILPECNTTEIIKCPDGSVVNQDPLLDCDFPACPEGLDVVKVEESVKEDDETRETVDQVIVNECPSDLFICPSFVMLRRDPALGCEYPECPTPKLRRH